MPHRRSTLLDATYSVLFLDILRLQQCAIPMECIEKDTPLVR
ncbi:hypothetical protein B1M_08652, partial [Burkholderia sp. TJI49]